MSMDSAHHQIIALDIRVYCNYNEFVTFRSVYACVCCRLHMMCKLALFAV